MALTRLEDRLVPDGRPAPLPMLFAGSGAGSAPLVKAYDGDTGAVAFTVSPYESTFTGGVNVAALDLNADSVPDVVTGPGLGGGPRVMAFDGKTGQQLDGPLGSIWAFESSFTGGVSVAAGDVTGDGVPDVVVGAGAGGGPRVRVFDGKTGDCVADFYAFEPSFTGGVNVAAADLTLDGKAEVIVGAGPGGGPRVTAFDLSSGTPTVARGFFTDFLAGDAEARGGASVAVGDVNGDHIPDVIAGPAAGPGDVKVFNGFDGSVMSDFPAFDASYTDGVRVSSFYLSDDPYADIVVSAAGAGGPGVVKVFDAGTGRPLADPGAALTPFGDTGGASVAAANDPGAGGTILSIASNVASAAVGQVFTLTATVTQHSTTGGGGEIGDDPPSPPPPPPPPITPTGTVTFYVQQTSPAAGNVMSVGTVALVGSGPSSATATLAVTGLALNAGTYDVWQTYSGDANLAANTLTTHGTVTVVSPPSAVPAPMPVWTNTVTGMVAQPTGSGLNNPPPRADGGVRLGDATFTLTRDDFAAADAGDSGWAQMGGVTTAGGYGTPGAGAGAVLLPLPVLTQVNGNDCLAVQVGGADAVFFDQAGGAYVQRYGGQARLSLSGGQFTFIDGRGNSWVFYDFSGGTPTGRAGRLVSATTADGTTISVTAWDGSGRPTEAQRVIGSGSAAVTESMVWTYLSSGANAGLMDTATLRRKVGTGSWATVRAAAYAYYVNTDANGRATQLKTAIVLDGAANVLETTYYRYSVPSSGTGPVKAVFGQAAYAQLTAALGTGVDALTDSQVAPYADHALSYDTNGWVTTSTVAGAGCSACSGGQGTYTYTYGSNTAVQGGANVWAGKAVETLPDGSTYTYYTNSSGQLMLKVYTDAATSQQWRWYTKYDTLGRVVLSAGPAVVTGYSESYADLVNDQGGNYQYLADAAGEVQTSTYATTTTATSSSAGNATGYLSGTAIRRGELGADVPQSAATYILRSAGGQDFVFPASSTRYRNDDGTGGETTTSAYTWQGSTATPAAVTKTLPAVTTAENGPNAATSMVTVSDSFGRPIWAKDAAGILTYTAYDAQTGVVVKTIYDVDTSRASDFANLPSGWSTPTGGGLHLITTSEVDDFGRVTKQTSPSGRVDYTVYDDANYEVRYYPAWATTTNAPTGPTTVTRIDQAGRYTETLTMSAAPTVVSGRPTGTESISGIQSLSRDYSNDAGQVTHTDKYCNLVGLTYSTAADIGTLNTNYYRTTTGYSPQFGQVNRTVTAAGTITRTEYDGMARVSSVWVGTDDTPTTGYWSTTNLAGTDMVKVTQFEYDGGGVGDGQLTKVTRFPGGGAANRVTQTFYDWRDRAVAVKQGVETAESTDVNRPITYTDYDNLGEVTKARTYDGDGVTVTSTAGVPNPPSSTLLRSQKTASYDELGRAYSTDQYSVDPSSGGIGTYTLHTDVWYDARGQVVKSVSPGSPVLKASYDGVGRSTAKYVTDGGGDSGYADAANVTGDTVLTQEMYAYDADGNMILTTHRDRFHDATGTGALGTPSSGVAARVSYAATYYDLASRPTATVDVGTNGGTAWTRPTGVPTRSDTVLVTGTTYDSAGRVYEVTDPRGLVTRTLYDALGRTTKTIENYVNGVVSDADDKTIEYTYGQAGMMSLTAKLTGGGGQTTAWVYGVSSTTGSTVVSNDAVGEVHWPDPSTGAASSGQKDTATLNALGETLATTDRNGTEHVYAYDVLGRATDDTVVLLGTNVDGAVRRRHADYDGQGNEYLLSSYDSTTSGSLVNQVERVYNGLGQLTTEYQAHGGSVNTTTTPKVQYAYVGMSGGVNNSRLTSLTYPNGRTIGYNYSSGLNDTISRLSSITDSTTTLVSYDFLGLDTVVKTSHPQPGVDLTYIKQSGESNADAGDQYIGLDRFGRVADQRYRSGSADIDRYQYSYDRDGSPTARINTIDTSLNESYAYDGLNQITAFTRGSYSQAWDYDAVGNMDSVTTGSITQTRSVNKQNEITSISGATTPGYDANGNLTTDETGKQYVYDAWNRLVTVKSSGGTTLETFAYDVRGYKMSRTTGGVTTDLYYSNAWQVLEERVSGTATTQYVWSPQYTDAMIVRDRDTDANGTLDERLYPTHDATFAITGLLNSSGTTVERYAGTPSGTTSIFDASFSALSGTNYGWVYYYEGNRLDAIDGWLNDRNREYSQSLARWNALDPLGFRGGSSNLYVYELNRAAYYLDPSGLFSMPGMIAGNVIGGVDGFLDGMAIGNDVGGPLLGLALGAANGVNGAQVGGVRGGAGLNPPNGPKPPDAPGGVKAVQFGFGWIPQCPCTKAEAIALNAPNGPIHVVPDENQFLNNFFHPGATSNIRIWYHGQISGNQCTYAANGQLITGGGAAGTPDVVGPGGGQLAPVGHFYADVVPFIALTSTSMWPIIRNPWGFQDYHNLGWSPINAACGAQKITVPKMFIWEL